MGIKTYERMEVNSNLDAAIALARTLYDLEDRRITEDARSRDLSPFPLITDQIFRECYLTLNDAARNIGYGLYPIETLDDTRHWVQITDYQSGERAGVWDGLEWIKF